MLKFNFFCLWVLIVFISISNNVRGEISPPLGLTSSNCINPSYCSPFPCVTCIQGHLQIFGTDIECEFNFPFNPLFGPINDNAPLLPVMVGSTTPNAAFVTQACAQFTHPQFVPPLLQPVTQFVPGIGCVITMADGARFTFPNVSYIDADLCNFESICSECIIPPPPALALGPQTQ